MKKLTAIIFFLFLCLILSGCANSQKIVQAQLEPYPTFKPPKVHADLQRVFKGKTVLVSDQVDRKSKPLPAMLPPKVKSSDISEKSPFVKLIVVDLDLQTLCAYGDENRENLLNSYSISGADGPDLAKNNKSDEPHNHLGKFSVLDKDVDHISGVYNCPMPLAIHYFEGHYIHQTEPKFYDQIGTPASHGCIRETRNDAVWLFAHTKVGAKVIIERSNASKLALADE